MRRVFLIVVLFFLTGSSLYSQTNESSPSLYKWKGKKTEFQDGYVVLKSGAKLEGKISLQGSRSNVEEIEVQTEDKELSLPLSALKSYGLNAVKANNETDQVLYEWRNSGETMGKTIQKTKPRNGYVITQNDQRFEGEMQLKKVDGRMDQITIKNDNGREKIDFQDVKEYGLLMSVNELTKNGEKTYRQPGRNFSKGKVNLNDGSKRDGWIAFREHKNTSLGFIYNVILFAKEKDTPIETIEDDKIKGIIKNEMGEDIVYKPFEDGFVSIKDLENAEFKDPSKGFCEGIILMKDGSKKEGVIAQKKIDKYRSQVIIYKNEANIVEEHGIDLVESFTQNYEDRDHKFVVRDEYFVKMAFDGKAFRLVYNPNPTHVNESATKLARTGTNIAANAGQELAVNLYVKQLGFPDDEERKQNVRNYMSKVNAMSEEELEENRQAVLTTKGKTEEEYEAELNNKERYDMLDIHYKIITSEQAQGIISESMQVYYKEWILLNKLDSSVTYLWKQDYNDQIEGVLKGCLDYLTMDKNQQKEFKGWDTRLDALKLVDDCYSGN